MQRSEFFLHARDVEISYVIIINDIYQQVAYVPHRDLSHREEGLIQ